MKIEKDSYLYKYLYWWNDGSSYRMPKDTCSLMYQLVWSVVAIAFLSAICISVTWILIAPVVYGVMWFFGVSSNEFISAAAGVGIGVWAAFFVLVGIAYVENYSGRPKRESKTSELWRHFKDKTCGRIEYD